MCLKFRDPAADGIDMRWLCAAVGLLALQLPVAAGAGECNSNVVFLTDTSGSMANVRWHPAFDPEMPPICSDFTSTFQSLNTTSQTHCGTTRTYFVDPALAARGIATRFDPRYLDFLHDLPDGSPILAEIASPGSGTLPACLGGGSYAAYQESRLTAAQRFVRDVVCQVSQARDPRLGLARLRVAADPAGGYLAVPVDDESPAQLSLLENGIGLLEPTGWGPLGEALFQIYTSFMSRNPADLPLGADGLTPFPAYAYATDGSFTLDPPPSPVVSGCEENLVVVLADDAPTRDDFDTDASNEDLGFESFQSLIGNYNPDDLWPEAGNEQPGASPTCPGGCEVALYLDDIAAFMSSQDLRPDLAGVQNVRTYTVGFDSEVYAAALLEKTAAVGGGLFLGAADADLLAQEIIAATPPDPIPVPALSPRGRLLAILAVFGAFLVGTRALQ